MVNLKSIFKRAGSATSLSFNGSNSSNDCSTKSSLCSLNQEGLPKFAPYNLQEADMYRHRRQIGVNLGSIFILDRQLAPPSLLSCLVRDDWESELDFLEACMTEEQAKEALEDHWSSVVNDRDLKYLASIGINSVRVPIGYWIVGAFANTPFKKYEYVYQFAWKWLLHLISKAAKYNIGVIVDLHGAPGGQNTRPHSGTSTHKAQFFKNSNQELTLTILRKLAVQLAPINNVIGLDILNEPLDETAALQNFYLSAYKAIRQATPGILLPIYMSDAFNSKQYADFIQHHSLKFVVLDIHYPFNKSKRPPALKSNRRSSLAAFNTAPLHVSLAESKRHLSHTHLKKISHQLHGNLIIGEWSSLLEHVQDVKKIREFTQSQLDVYNDIGAGHYFWNYRTTNDGDYSSFVFCHKTHILPRRYGTLDALSAQEASKLAKSRYNCCLSTSTVAKENEDFKQGFKAGFELALVYLLEYQAQIGFKRQLAHEQSRKRHPHYEKGFTSALYMVDRVICEFMADTD
ncbi:glycoside hydrolase [Mucor ambiguus]|uniref:Glycoside hydrolase n=1 Tax=Mucor ambiguus TaxID=91626 RepID=A0A0C9MFP1_9FUNG|nr:glycoside hydrolase [Mucor ambiguus]